MSGFWTTPQHAAAIEGPASAQPPLRRRVVADRHSDEAYDEAYDVAVSEGWPVLPESGAALGDEESVGDSRMRLEWQQDDVAGSVWSSTIEDGQGGWFEVQLERATDGWEWVITHERACWGRAPRFDEAKAVVAAQLERAQDRLPRCEIRPFMENERGRYLITFVSFPGVVASGASPEDAIRRGRDALAAYRGCLRAGEGMLPSLDAEAGTPPTDP